MHLTIIAKKHTSYWKYEKNKTDFELDDASTIYNRFCVTDWFIYQMFDLLMKLLLPKIDEHKLWSVNEFNVGSFIYRKQTVYKINSLKINSIIFATCSNPIVSMTNFFFQCKYLFESIACKTFKCVSIEIHYQSNLYGFQEKNLVAIS